MSKFHQSNQNECTWVEIDPSQFLETFFACAAFFSVREDKC